MKSVLISIQPKWCELIASGKKTVDVRKTRPKLEPPFKVYVYQTKHREHNGQTHSDGKVIGEFICDDITKILNFGTCFMAEGRSKCELNTIARSSCLDFTDMRSYFGTTKEGYAWHISDLVIYDQPRSLTGFYHYCGDDPKCDGCELLYYSNTECGKNVCRTFCESGEGYSPSMSKIPTVDVVPRAEVLEAVDEFKNDLMDVFIGLCGGNDYNRLNLLKIGDTVARVYNKHITELKKRYTVATKPQGGEKV